MLLQCTVLQQSGTESIIQCNFACRAKRVTQKDKIKRSPIPLIYNYIGSEIRGSCATSRKTSMRPVDIMNIVAFCLIGYLGAIVYAGEED